MKIALPSLSFIAQYVVGIIGVLKMNMNGTKVAVMDVNGIVSIYEFVMYD